MNDRLRCSGHAVARLPAPKVQEPAEQAPETRSRHTSTRHMPRLEQDLALPDSDESKRCTSLSHPQNHRLGSNAPVHESDGGWNRCPRHRLEAIAGLASDRASADRRAIHRLFARVMAFRQRHTPRPSDGRSATRRCCAR